jgi:hypothetical protein
MPPVKLLPFMIPLFHLVLSGEIARAPDLTAVLLQVEGIVTVTERSAPGDPKVPTRPRVRRARLLQVIRSGDALRIPAGAHVGLVCSTDRWVLLLSTKSERRLDDKICAAGRPLLPGVYRSLAPEAGRLRSLRGAMVLERRSRGAEDVEGRTPVLLEPRNTAILEGRPVIRWTRVKEAANYLIELTGAVSSQAQLGSKDVSCGLSQGWGTAEVCVMPYPASFPEIPPGALVHLTIAARSATSPWYRETNPGEVRRLPADGEAVVHEGLQELAKLPVGELAHRLLEADLYASKELFAGALSSYRDAGLQHLTEPLGTPSWQVGNRGEILVTLGDIYFDTGLLAPAAWSYELAVRSRQPLIQAAAFFGLGRVEVARKNFALARSHFLKSRDFYAEQGLSEESHAAAKALESTLE